jgi:transcriptional regulator with XRE-family HTH domain
MPSPRRPLDTFAERLNYLWFRRQALLGRKIGQSEIARDVGRLMGRESFTQAAVSRWLNGEVDPDVKTVLAIAQAFEVDPGWLAFGTGEPPNDPAAPSPMPEPPKDRLR